MQDASAHYLHVHTCIQNTPIPYICTHSFRNLCEKWFIRVEQLINVTEQLRFAVYSFLFVIPGAFYHSNFQLECQQWLQTISYFINWAITAEDCVTNDVGWIGSIDTEPLCILCVSIRSHLIQKLAMTSCGKSQIRIRIPHAEHENSEKWN